MTEEVHEGDDCLIFKVRPDGTMTIYIAPDHAPADAIGWLTAGINFLQNPPDPAP